MKGICATGGVVEEVYTGGGKQVGGEVNRWKYEVESGEV